MRTYKIFLKKSKKGTIEDLQIIYKGFDFLAFLLQIFYLFYQKLKVQAKTTIIVFVVLYFLYYLSFSIYTIIILYLVICVYIGFKYHDWKSRNLLMRGYEFLGTIGGKNQKQAKLDFLEKLNDNYQEKDKLEQKIY